MSIVEHLLQLERCPKCGEFVSLDNNGALFDLIVHQAPDPLVAVLVTQAFHLLPVIQEGEVICVGSPSRTQYLEGRPRDTRPQIVYKPERESAKRAAFARLQELCSPPAA